MPFNVGERVRLQKWVNLPSFTPKTGIVQCVETDGTYTVTLKDDSTVKGLWESDLQVSFVEHPR